MTVFLKAYRVLEELKTPHDTNDELIYRTAEELATASPDFADSGYGESPPCWKKAKIVVPEGLMVFNCEHAVGMGEIPAVVSVPIKEKDCETENIPGIRLRSAINDLRLANERMSRDSDTNRPFLLDLISNSNSLVVSGKIVKEMSVQIEELVKDCDDRKKPILLRETVDSIRAVLKNVPEEDGILYIG